ncbi:MAG: hypothetical protein ACXVI9_11740 [Mucilaginibacter sp.]
MDQYLNNRQNEILWRLLANPADNGNLYGFNLQQFAKDFPQSGLLQAMLARANGGENLPHAAATFDSKALYVMMNAYENLAEVSEEQIVQKLGESGDYGVQQEEPHLKLNDFSDGKLKDILGFEPGAADEEQTHQKVVVGEDERHEVDNISIDTEAGASVIEEMVTDTPAEPEPEIPEAETIPEPLIPESSEEPVAQIENVEDAIVGTAETEPTAEIPVEDHRAEVQLSPYEEEIIELPEEETEEPITEIPEDHRAEMHAHIYDEEINQVPETTVIEPSEVEAAPQAEEIETTEAPAEEPEMAEAIHTEPVKDIDDEVYDEIVGIESISFAFANKPEEVVQPDAAAQEETPVESPVEGDSQRDDIGKLMSEGLAETDHFVFERTEEFVPAPDVKEAEPAFTEELEFSGSNRNHAGNPFAEAETQDVSKYHDEKMPYTFMWWLDKTRKEHAGVYQPFKLDTTQVIRHAADETLQQQYYENIFHVSTVEELDRDAARQAIEFDMQNKEDRIIKKFITEEPHISAPTSDRLGNENKAKRSAEDQDELVTETLAKIYSDQMLYHKAINTYKKLILKFPEKSRYFADQIELLERKIN